MPKLEWDKIGERLYETGVKKGVLYIKDIDGTYQDGVAWNGLTAVTESPSGAEISPLYAANIKYLSQASSEEFEITIEAFTYPEEFEQCDGSIYLTEGVKIGQRSRKLFGLTYQTLIGNDVEGIEYGYKIHILYSALAEPTESLYETINDEPEAMTFSWDITTSKINVTGKKSIASLVIDSTKINPIKLIALENILYGDEENQARLPLPEEIESAEYLSPDEITWEDANYSWLDANYIWDY